MSDLEDLLKGETNFYVVSDDDQPDTPTDLYGIWLAVGLFSGFIVLSVCVVAVIMYVSRAQERAKTSQRQSRQEALRTSIACKPWGPNDTERTAKAPVPDSATPTVSSDASRSWEQSSSSNNEDEEVARPAAHAMILQPEEGSICAMCSKDFEGGQPVYESNNPDCGHVCHKACMDKWLQYQNTCPTCNLPFVLQQTV